MNFDHVLSAFYGHPWAILPEKLDLIEAALLARVYGSVKVTAEEMAAFDGAFRGGMDDDRPNETKAKKADDKPKQDVRGGVAVVGVRGTITPRPSAFSSGGTSARAIAERVKLAADDGAVSSILLDVDSPGGSVYGIEEAAAAITAARSRKPVWASADPYAASAAYWLASQADRVFIAPGGQLGSIGVVNRHFDRSKATEKDGVMVTELATAKYKTEGTPYAGLSPESRIEILRVAGLYHARFVEAVARGRRVDAAKVEKDFGAGRMVLDREAVAAGMADGVAPFPDVLGTLQTLGRAGRGRAVAAALTLAHSGRRG